MLKIINGKRYNTETAEKLCDLPCEVRQSEIGWHKTELYLTANGAFFLAGKGNAWSMWDQSAPGSSGPGEGIRPVGDDEARSFLEAAGKVHQIERLFTVADA